MYDSVRRLRREGRLLRISVGGKVWIPSVDEMVLVDLHRRMSLVVRRGHVVELHLSRLGERI